MPNYLEKAIANYENAIRIDPELSVVFTDLGNAYRDQGKFSEAVENYEKALERLQLFTGDYSGHHLRPDVHRAIARVYEYGLDQTDLALREYQTILIKYPNYLFIDEVRTDITRLESEE